MLKITLLPGKEISAGRFHPWIFSGAIKTKSGNSNDGTITEVYASDGNFIGMGFYHNSSIAVRLFSFEKVVPDSSYWKTKLQTALDIRKNLGIADNPETNCYRLCFGEADGIPGLVIDYYHGNLVMQCHNTGIYNYQSDIVAALLQLFDGNIKTIYDKSAEVLAKSITGIKNSYLFGETPEVTVSENNFLFKVNWEKGQKTGFFLDQRENRKLLMNYARGKHVLNTFCYTGGFSVYASKGGAKQVHSVDASAVAIELTNENARLNQLNNHESFVSDTFQYLKTARDKYDLIILDPPAYAKSRDVKHNAVVGYKKLNALAIKQIKPGGIIFTFSCSGVIDRQLFNNTIAAAAIEARRQVRILHYLSQPADHPVSPFFPEGEYLKGLVLYVE